MGRLARIAWQAGQRFLCVVHEGAQFALSAGRRARSSPSRPACSRSAADREARLKALISNRKLHVAQATPDRIGARWRRCSAARSLISR